MEHPLPITKNRTRTFRNFMMNQSRKIQMKKNFPQKMLKTSLLKVLDSLPEALLMRGLYPSIPSADSKRQKVSRLRTRLTTKPSLRRKHLFLLARSMLNDTLSSERGISATSAEKAQREITNAISIPRSYLLVWCDQESYDAVCINYEIWNR